MKPSTLLSLSLSLGMFVATSGCASSHRSERRYDTPNLAAVDSSAHETPTNRRAKLVNPVNQALALNGLPASEIAKRNASTLATNQNLAANQQLRNGVYNYNNTLDAPGNQHAPYVVFKKNDNGEMTALMVDPSTSHVVNEAKVQDNNGKAQFAFTDAAGQPAVLDTNLLSQNVKEGALIIEGTKQAIDLQMYAERANFELDQMDDARSQMAFEKFARSLSMINGAADSAAFSTDRLGSVVNSWRQITGADPRAVYGGYQPFQGGTVSWSQFFSGRGAQGIQPR